MLVAALATVGFLFVATTALFMLALQQIQKALDANRRWSNRRMEAELDEQRILIKGIFPGVWRSPDHFQGMAGPHELNIQRFGPREWKISLDRVARGVNIFADAGHPLQSPDHLVGDRPFDDAFVVNGDAMTASALFANPQLRRWIRHYHGTIEMRDGRLTAQMRRPDAKSIQNLLKAASYLRQPSDLGAALQKGWGNAKNPGMYRAACLNHHLTLSVGSERIAIAESAVRNRDPYVAVPAAAALDTPEATEILLDISNGHLPPRLFVFVLREIHDRIGLTQLLDDVEEPERLRAILRAINTGSPLSARAVASLVLNQPPIARHWPAAQAALKHIAKYGDSDCEPELLQLLALRSLKPAVRLRVVMALGHLGTIRAVEALYPLREAPNTPTLLAGQVETAIAEIQSRLEGVEAGRLAVAEVQVETGALSTAGQSGQLSAVKK